MGGVYDINHRTFIIKTNKNTPCYKIVTIITILFYYAVGKWHNPCCAVTPVSPPTQSIAASLLQSKSYTRFDSVSPLRRLVLMDSCFGPPHWQSWHLHRVRAPLPWPVGSWPVMPYEAVHSGQAPVRPLDPTLPARYQPPRWTHLSPHTLQQNKDMGDDEGDKHTTERYTKVGHLLTFLSDAVHHWAKNEYVCAAVSTAAKPAITAETCGANGCQARDTLLTQSFSAWLLTQYITKFVCNRQMCRPMFL